jgi:NTE family protein
MSAPIRIAFSGSGFKTPAHVGALAAVHDAGYTPVEYAGTSGGSIVAALAACGMPLAEMQALTMQQDWSNMLEFNPLSIFERMAFCNGDNLLEWLLQHTGSKTFAQLGVDLTIVATDLGAGAPFVFSRQTTPSVPVALAARASAAIPIVYAPVQYAGRYLVDGGVENNIPVDKLVIDKAPRLGVHLDAKVAPLKPGLHTIMTIAPRVLELTLDAQEDAHIQAALASGAKICHVETGYADGLDRNMAREIRQRLYDGGYAAAKAELT